MNPAIADRLTLVLKHNGPSLLDDPDSLRRLLAPAQNPPPPEVHAILAVLESKAVQYLQKWDRHTGDKVPYAQVREHIAASMARAGALDADAAAWALDAWMRALMLRGDAPRLKLELEPVAPPPDTPAADAPASRPVPMRPAGLPAAPRQSPPAGRGAGAPFRSERLTPLGEPVTAALSRAPADEDDAPVSRFVAGGRSRPISHGWRWFAEGWQLFTAAPLMWIALTVICLVGMGLIGLIPIVGMIAGVVLTPILFAGLMLGAQAVDDGQPLTFGHLFAGFQSRVGSLVGLGVLITVLSIGVAVIIAMIFGASLMQLAAIAKLDPSALGRSIGLLLGVATLAAVLLMPLSMAWYFSPALISIDEQGPMAAIGSSLMGCLRNALPLLVYGLIFILLAIVATIPFGLGWLVLLPVTVTSTFAAYRDIFHDE